MSSTFLKSELFSTAIKQTKGKCLFNKLFRTRSTFLLTHILKTISIKLFLTYEVFLQNLHTFQLAVIVYWE